LSQLFKANQLVNLIKNTICFLSNFLEIHIWWLSIC